MNKLTTLFLAALFFIGVTAFAVSDQDQDRTTPPLSSQFLDQLTDELLYMADLCSTAEDRLSSPVHAELAGQMAAVFQQHNRELCQLIIDRGIPAKRVLSDEQERAVVSLMPLRREILTQRFEQLLRSELDTIQLMIDHQKPLLDEREVLDFVQQLENTRDDFRTKINILN